MQQSLSAAPEESRAAIEKMLVRCRLPASPGEPLASPADLLAIEEPTNVDQAAALSTVMPLNELSYEDWFASVFRQHIPAPEARIATSWPEDSDWGRRAFLALVQLEVEYATHLLAEIRDNDIQGDVAEFGIFEGWWINLLWQATEQLRMPRRIYGFDSFAGLSDPHPQFDQACWKTGQYACSLEQVAKNVQLADRPRIKLVQGYFADSLRGADAQVAGKFAYVRIDCDIYEPALACLRYLAPRLADGAILIFDNWPHVRGLGEQHAFEEWLPTVPQLEFEFLFYGVIGHFYTPVHHRE